MNDNPEALYEKNDDVDLTILLRKVTKFFRTYFLLIGITTFIGLLFGFLLSKTVKRYYTSRILLESSVLSNAEQNELIENWDRLTGPAYPLLQKELNCSAGTARSILGIQEEALPNLPDGTNVFALEVKFSDTSLVQNIQEALLSAIKNNQHVHDKVALRHENLRRQIKEAEAEKTKLDTTNEYIQSLVGNGKKDNDRLILDVSSISTTKIALTEKLSAYKEQMAADNGVQLIQSATPAKGPKPGTVTLCSLGLVVGFIMGYFLAATHSIFRISKQVK